MKKLLSIKFAVIICALMIIPGLSNAAGFNGVASTDGNFVVAVGNNGNVFISTNGGNNWQKGQIGTINLNSVCAVGNTVYIAGGDGSIYKTTETTYTTFEKYPVASGFSLNGIYFRDVNTGYVCGNDGKVYRTFNGGVIWSVANSGITSVKLNAIHFYGVSNGIVVGDNGTIYSSSNGGNSWVPRTSGTTRNLTDGQYFINEIIVTGEYGTLLRKVASGPFNPVNTRTVWDINAIAGTSKNDVHLCGGGGFIRNNDGSADYLNFEANPMMADLVDISFVNPTIGFAVSSLNDAVIKTTDGGATWNLAGGTTISYSWTQVLNPGSGGIGNGLAAIPTVNRDIVFLCQSNRIYRSGDRGATWTQIATVSGASSCHSFYVNPLDTNMMLGSFGSTGGTVRRSTDYGQTWTTVWGPGTLTSYGMPMEMDQNNPNVVYLGPDNSVLLKSTNFGATWTNHGNVTFRSPCDFTVQDENSNVMFCGDGVTFGGSDAVLWKSTDNGVNWDTVHTTSGSEIPMIGISQLDVDLAFHTCWSSGGVWRSTDAFSNVGQIATTGSAWACDVAKDDPTAFSYSTYGGLNYVSWNTGSNFTSTQDLGTNAGMLYLHKGNLLQQSTGSLDRLTVNYNVPSNPIVITGLDPIAGSIPTKYDLFQNYPNPFNPSTKIKFDIPKQGSVRLTIYDQLGRMVSELVNADKNAGSYEIEFNASNLASGIYFYKLEVPGQTFTKKMMLVK